MPPVDLTLEVDTILVPVRRGLGRETPRTAAAAKDPQGSHHALP